jgi:large subunit ribosomal protein L22
MEATAKLKYLKGSPRKTRLVIDTIRGRNVSQALNILKFTDKRAADPIDKCLRSAIANATYLAERQNIAIDPDDLFVKACFVDMGPTKHRRRMRPAPQGRAYREQRHYCHITVLVSSDKPEVQEFVPNPKTEEKKKAIAAQKKAEEAERKKAAKKKADEEKVVAAPIEETVETTETVETAAEETVETVEAAPAEEAVEAKAEETAPAEETAATEATDEAASTEVEAETKE